MQIPRRTPSVAGLVTWLRARDPDLAATRRAGRTAIVMPALFALCTQVLHSPTMASFAAFGSFSMLLMVDFSGPMVERLRAQAALAAAWAALICVGTLVAQATWLAVVTTLLIAFVILFSGVVSSVLAGSATSLLLAFVLPVSTPVPLSLLPERLAGTGLAATAALPAVWLLWPRPVADPLIEPATRVCRAAAAHLRADASGLDRQATATDSTRRRAAAEETAEASTDLRNTFNATPYRPTGLSTASRTLVRLVDELNWLSTILEDRPAYTDAPPACDPTARRVRLTAADVLDHTANVLTDMRVVLGPLRSATAELREAMQTMEKTSTVRLPADHSVGDSPEEIYGFIATLDLSFRARELGFAVLQIADNVATAAAASQRHWLDRLLVREPGALTEPLAVARERATAHLGLRSVWLHNSLRGAVGLGIAVLIANLTGVQHSFWVLLGTLSVLRSNALNTGQNALRAVLGTVAGSIIGAGLLQLIGHHGTVLWFLLPLAILVAGIAPSAISFAAGQAAFTVTLVVMFNLGQDPDWHIVLLRMQDIALGCAVSLLVALFFWPRGAATAVHKALADAYVDGARYLAEAVDYALGQGGQTDPARPRGEPLEHNRKAAASARRLDDAFRTYLDERGAKPLSLTDMTALVAGVAALRLAADAVVSLWRGVDPGRETDGRTEAHRAIRGAASRVTEWYYAFAGGLDHGAPVPEPVQLHPEAAALLVESVRTDHADALGRPGATAVRIIWTGDHVDVARRLQPGLALAAKGSAIR
ncbi:FUSC family protein [Streptomyces sp. NPDC057690]|uniref:FUSC family protein n=1 Tax=Streptomyces sp. NPDC057690 TaxID=3346214 RepID=UPI003674FF0F